MCDVLKQMIWHKNFGKIAQLFAQGLDFVLFFCQGLDFELQKQDLHTFLK